MPDTSSTSLTSPTHIEEGLLDHSTPAQGSTLGPRRGMKRLPSFGTDAPIVTAVQVLEDPAVVRLRQTEEEAEMTRKQYESTRLQYEDLQRRHTLCRRFLLVSTAALFSVVGAGAAVFLVMRRSDLQAIEPAVALPTPNATSSSSPTFSPLEDCVGFTMETERISSITSTTIPTCLGRLTQLKELEISGRELVGTIPTELGMLTQLSSLWLNSNKLTGTLPTELGGLQSITFLDVWGNALTGTVPTELGQLTTLTRLGLYQTPLTGTIPTEVGELTDLTTLNLYNNDLTGSLPTEFGQLTNLLQLSLRDNRLTGSIPVHMAKLAGLSLLYLYNNQLTGAIPIWANHVPDADLSGNNWAL